MVREFEMKDIDEVMRIWFNANTQAHFFIDPMYWQQNIEGVKDRISHAEVYVFDDNGVIEGFIGLEGNTVSEMFVKPELHSRGIGTALLDEVKNKKKTLSLKVYQKNWTAVRFYSTQDFDEEDIQVDKDTGEKEILMTWIKPR